MENEKEIVRVIELLGDSIKTCVMIAQGLYDDIKKDLGITIDAIYIRYCLKDLLRAEEDYTEFHSQIFKRILEVKKPS